MRWAISSLLLVRRLRDHDLHQEPVPLGLGQGVDTLGLDRVLGGQDEEGGGDLAGLAPDRHLPFGHYLEQGRLDLGRGAVDLIGEHDVGEHRTPLDVELLPGRPPDAGADDVGGHQVGGELDAAERSSDDPGQGRHGQRLGQARDALDEAVTSGEQAEHRPLDHAVLADDDPLHLEEGVFEQRGAVVVGRLAGRGGVGPHRDVRTAVVDIMLLAIGGRGSWCATM